MKALIKHPDHLESVDFLQLVDLLTSTPLTLTQRNRLEDSNDSDSHSTISEIPSRTRGPTRASRLTETFREDKVAALRHQFHLGRYQVETRLVEILDKLYEDLTGEP